MSVARAPEIRGVWFPLETPMNVDACLIRVRHPVGGEGANTTTMAPTPRKKPTARAAKPATTKSTSVRTPVKAASKKTTKSAADRATAKKGAARKRTTAVKKSAPRKKTDPVRGSAPRKTAATVKNSAIRKAKAAAPIAIKRSSSTKKVVSQRTGNAKTERKKVVTKRAGSKTAKRKSSSLGSRERAVPAKAPQRKGKKPGGEHALYEKEVEQLEHQRKTPVPAVNVPKRAEGNSQPEATYDPTPDTYVPPRGQTALDRNVQSERVAGMRRSRARMARTGIPNAGGRRRRG